MKFATSVTLLPPLLSTAGARLQHQQTPRFLLEDGQYSFNTDAAGAFQLVQGFATDDDKVVFSVGADEIGFKTGFVNIDGQLNVGTMDVQGDVDFKRSVSVEGTLNAQTDVNISSTLTVKDSISVVGVIDDIGGDVDLVGKLTVGTEVDFSTVSTCDLGPCAPTTFTSGFTVQGPVTATEFILTSGSTGTRRRLTIDELADNVEKMTDVEEKMTDLKQELLEEVKTLLLNGDDHRSLQKCSNKDVCTSGIVEASAFVTDSGRMLHIDIDQQDARINALEQENEALKEELEAIKKMITAIAGN